MSEALKLFFICGIMIFIILVRNPINLINLVLLSIPFSIYIYGLCISPILIFFIFIKFFVNKGKPSQARMLHAILMSLVIIYTIAMINHVYSPLKMKIMGPLSQEVYNLWGYLSFLASVAFIYIVFKLIKDKVDLIKTINVFFIAIIVNILLLILTKYFPNIVSNLPGFLKAENATNDWTGYGAYYSRFGGTFKDYEILGEYALFSISLFFGAFKITQKRIYLLGIILSLALIFSTGSLGAVFPLAMISILYIMFFSSKKVAFSLQFWVIIFILIFSFVFANFLSGGYFTERLIGEKVFVSATNYQLPSFLFWVPITRIYPWTIFFNWLPSIPIYGYGPISSMNVIDFMSPHSLYLDYYFKFGIIGLSTFFILIIYTMRKSYIFYKKNKLEINNNVKNNMISFLPYYFIAFIAILISGFKIEFTRYINSLYYFPYLIGVLFLIIEKEKNKIVADSVDHKTI